MSGALPVVTSAEYAAAERYRHKARWRCPADQQTWFSVAGLKRHMAILHHACRFCPRAYIRVNEHEKRSHTIEYAIAAGACSRRREAGR